MTRFINYWRLLVLALVLGGIPLDASAALAVGDFEIVEPETRAGVVTLAQTLSNNKPITQFRRPTSPVPTYQCGSFICECHGEEDCNQMFEELDCGRAVCEGSGDNNYCVCIWPVELYNPKKR